MSELEVWRKSVFGIVKYYMQRVTKVGEITHISGPIEWKFPIKEAIYDSEIIPGIVLALTKQDYLIITVEDGNGTCYQGVWRVNAMKGKIDE